MSLRRTSDRLWGDQCFITSQVLGWLVVVASFGSAIAAASHAPALVVAIAAAIPGTVILIDQRFDFARQAQWHWMQENEIRELEHALSFTRSGQRSFGVKRYSRIRSTSLSVISSFVRS
jgi:hypothetical protein